MAVKYVFVLGGVVSGLGKGITAASLGRLLKARGYAVTMQKFDPYINVDPGTMNPIQHGEVFVTDDGAETDLDLGHYERFIDERLTRVSNVTSGRVYRTVLERERRGDFGGGTVQVIPHITNEIKRRFYRGEDKIAIIEVGGTVGDMESQAFLEAIRQFQNEVGKENAIILLVITWFLWNKTTFGKNMFAVGSNAEAANVSGVNVFRTTVLVHTFAGVMYGLTGFIEGARISSITQSTGLNYECDAIAACVIGGVSFVGGTGKISGIVLGVLILRIIFAALTFLAIDSSLQYIIKGLIILVACSLDMRKYLVKK